MLKKTDIMVLPKILVIHLKRFVFDINDWRKIHEKIKFPVKKFKYRRYDN